MTSRRTQTSPQNTSQCLGYFKDCAEGLPARAVELDSYLSGHAAIPEWLNKVVQNGDASSLKVYTRVWKGAVENIKQITVLIDKISCLIREGQETITPELEAELRSNLDTYAAMILGLAALAHNHW